MSTESDQERPLPGGVQLLFARLDEMGGMALAMLDAYALCGHGISYSRFQKLIRTLVATDDLQIDEYGYITFRPLDYRPYRQYAKTPIARRQLSVTARLDVMKADGYRCRQCGAEDELTIDHITPLSAGGCDDPHNLQTLCRPCNSRKGSTVPA